MAIRNIVINDDEFLKKISREITNFDERLDILLDDLIETLKFHTNGIGLAAPQVGVLRRAAVIDMGNRIVELINPEIIIQKGRQNGSEGCLSYPNEYGIVKRPYYVKVKTYDRKGRPYFVEGEEIYARALCHEIDHLNGIVFKDLATRLVRNGE